MSGDPPWRKPYESEFQFAHEATIAKRYVRRRPIGGRVQALNWLHTTLVNDAQLYETGELQNQRDAVVHAIFAVVDYLRAQGFTEGTLVHLMRPAFALGERENGSIDMLFAEPVKRQGGRPKATLTQLERQGILGAIAEAWLLIHKQDERTQKQKLADCARRLNGRWFGTVTGANLKTALDLIRQEGKDHPAVRTSKIYFDGFLQGSELFGPQVAFDILIRMLNDQKLSYGAGEGGIAKTSPVSPSDGE